MKEEDNWLTQAADEMAASFKVVGPPRPNSPRPGKTSYSPGKVVHNPVPPRPETAEEAARIFAGVASGVISEKTGLDLVSSYVSGGYVSGGGTYRSKPRAQLISQPPTFDEKKDELVKLISRHVKGSEDPLTAAGEWLTLVNKAISEALDGLEE